MDETLKEKLLDNSLKYKRSLERIIDKYSKLKYQDGGIEVDLNRIKPRTLEHYVKLSKTDLDKLESKSLTELREDSLKSQDITRDSQLDFTHQDVGADESCVSSVSTSQISELDDGDISGDTESDSTQLTVNTLDESQWNLSEAELQPEDQDEQLEMTLRSHGRALGELYPSMLSRIERAWHRQYVSEAADCVLRRYSRWRQKSNRSSLNNTFTLKHNPKKMSRKTLLTENSCSPEERHFMGTETAPRIHLQMVDNLPDWKQRSPGGVRGSLRREKHQPILAMDLSGSSETSKPKEISLNETFTVCQHSPPEESQRGEQASYTVSPSLRSKRLSLAAHSSHRIDGCSMYASQSTAVEPGIYGSPVRQSPLKARMMSSFSRSPQAFSRSPKAFSVESFTREPVRPRSMSLSSLQQRPTVPLRMLYPQDSHHSLQPQLPPHESSTAAVGHHRLRRQLSFDSSLPSLYLSPKKVDEDFIKFYHKFVCQSKSSFNGPPCRFCARNSEANRGHLSSTLSALALSPHRFVPRKRHRELGGESHPQSKRFRDEYCASSPGYKQHRKEMVRCCLSPEPELEQSHDGCSYSSSKRSMFQRLSTQQRSTHQEAWMSPRRHVSVAESSGLGSSIESKMAAGCSPRKWW